MDGVNVTGKSIAVSALRVEPVRAAKGNANSGRGSDTLTNDPVVPATNTKAADPNVKDPLDAISRRLEKLFNERFTRLRLQIEHDDDAGRFVYKVIDKETGNIEDQFPAEEMLKILAYYRQLEGLFVDDEA